MQKISIDILNSKVNIDDIRPLDDKVYAALETLKSGKMELTGWVKLPVECDRSEIVRIKSVAEEISSKCSVLVVLGIGGSYLGARAVIEALACDPNNRPRIIFAGTNLSGTYHARLLKDLSDEEVCLCVISKSGGTTEIAASFAIFKEMLVRKYGADEAKKRIYTITDAEKGVLREETTREGYTSFSVPDNIGGRYSVLTAVGLLPIAVAGIDIEGLVEGARMVAGALTDGKAGGAKAPGGDCCSNAFSENERNEDFWYSQLCNYVGVRQNMMQQDASVEIIEYYEPQLEMFAGWTQQLLGESLGKDGKGVFPTSLAFSRDLHSMEQFLQEGRHIFFETVLHIENPADDVVIPEAAGELLAGKTLNQLNEIAFESVTEAHKKAGIPMVRIDIPELTPFCFGQLIQFLEMSCAVDGILAGVNPFNQPGVENYKAEMKKRLTQPA